MKSFCPSKRSVFLVLLVLCVCVCACALAAKDVITDFRWTPGDHSIEYEFTCPGENTVLLCFSNALESGTDIIHGQKGVFKGTVVLPRAYPGSNVTITINSLVQKPLMGKVQVSTAIAEIPAVEQAAEGRLKGITVCVDPGHQGVPIGIREPMGPGLQGFHNTDNGMAQGTFTKRMEAVVVLEIGLQLRNALLQEGANVVMTREDQNTPVSNVERAEIANNAGADLFIRLHCDASSQKAKNGIHVFVPSISDYAREVADKETHLAYGQAMLDAILATTGCAKGSALLSNEYVASNWAKMPAFLVEMGYMTNVREDILLSDPAYQQLLVRGMVDGLVEVARMRGLIE